MKKLQFTKDIHAPAEKVFNTMLGIDDIQSYEKWTAAFSPTSSYEGNWDKGSKMYFVGMDENGKKGGMVSEIADHIPSKFVSIRHYGMLDGETEITEGPDVEKWAGGLENYSFEENNGTTTLTVECDVTDDYIDFFSTTWEKALDTLKKLAEE